jgi:hypothetical protein
MVPGRDKLLIFLFFCFLIQTCAGDRNILLNGTNIYLATGDSYGLYQGYVLTIKSASDDGSVWLELTDGDNIVKSEIVYSPREFVYNKTNNTIISVRVGSVYSGSSEQNLLSLFLYQFTDPEKPLPQKTAIPENNVSNNNDSMPPEIKTPREPLIWTLGIALVLILFFIVRKLW